ncbi:MAG: hypothetical protein KGI54_13600 [Pseudomonadota bacterium]|nr:hypothetical protein [Pseudomonadota bacterium]
MAKWLFNGPCDHCGSKDNLGHWDDGSTYCWGCKFSSRSGNWVHPASLGTVEEATPVIKALPDDIGFDYGPDAVEWLGRFGISVERAIAEGIRYSRSFNQVIFVFNGESAEPVFWQARNLDPERAAKRRYYTQGNVKELLPIYNTKKVPQKKCLTIVEDCVSAIRVSDFCDSMPLLGSHLPADKLNRLKFLYPELIFWLDSDKFKEAQSMAKRAQMIGLKAHVIFTELDPKCYTPQQIMEYIQNV